MEIDLEDYDAVRDMNLRDTLYMTQAVVPQIRAQGAGSVACMSSVTGALLDVNSGMLTTDGPA